MVIFIEYMFGTVEQNWQQQKPCKAQINHVTWVIEEKKQKQEKTGLTGKNQEEKGNNGNKREETRRNRKKREETGGGGLEKLKKR